MLTIVTSFHFKIKDEDALPKILAVVSGCLQRLCLSRLSPRPGLPLQQDGEWGTVALGVARKGSNN